MDLLDDDEFDEMTLPTVEQCVAEVMVQPDSPRSSYIYECLLNRVNPRAHLLVRDKQSTALNLKHQGMVMTTTIMYIGIDLDLLTAIQYNIIQ